ncbi:MAG: hypothetical protein ACOYIR_01670 [Christensenellales bacterium]|jgi:hypothetical protein
MADRFKKSALVLFCLVLLSGCAARASGGYEVLDQLPESSDASQNEFDFSATLRLLYPKSESVVIALLTSAGPYITTAVPVRVLEGDSLAEDVEFPFILPLDCQPEEGAAYFLFLSNDGGSYSALMDENGMIRLEDDFLVTEGGAKISLSQALYELDKMQSYVYIPSYFYYQKELESLVEGSSVVCTGTVTSIEELSDVQFYVREPGLEEITSVPATAVSIQVEEYLKGEAEGSLRVILTDAMYRNTVLESTFDQPSYNQESLPELTLGGKYLFFLMDSPAGRHGDYLLFINPYQGYVPLYGDDTLIAIPINAPFSYMQNLEDVRMDIADIVSGYVYSNSLGPPAVEPDQEPPPPDEEELP